jgi:hypothetical protein
MRAVCVSGIAVLAASLASVAPPFWIYHNKNLKLLQTE